ncbi:MAG TPA: 2-hydroxyacid dehydrogenase [Rhizobiaceae bacterium]|nr:2-hydroxyacid dehydrogenase [Rhizobiaceae bacterium]
MASAHSDVTVVIPGPVHPYVNERIAREFSLIVLPTPDLSLMTPEQIASVRAIASYQLVPTPFIDAFDRLEILSNFGVGYDGVDARHCAAKGIMVTHTPDILTEEVADTTVGLLLNTAREFNRAEKWLREGKWESIGNYRFSAATLRGRHIGIFGMGRIGLAVAKRLKAMGLKISYHNRRQAPDVPYDYYPTLKDLATAVDTLISVVPGGPSTDRIVNAEILAALGPDGIFINIGRGSTVDEDALIAALTDGTILAAGLDVFADEPRVRPELIALENTVLLPHVGSASFQTRRAMANLTVDNLVSWFDGNGPLTPVPETKHLPHPKG